MAKEMNLVTVEQRSVDFYGDELIAVRADNGHVYVAIGQMCNALGLDRASQARRIRNNDILADGYQGAVNLTYPDGGKQPSGVLRVDLIPLWLTGVRLKAVREEIRPKLHRFQREAAKVLWEAFQDGRLTTDPTFDELLQTDSEAVQAYKMALAVVKLARNQVLLEGRLDNQERELTAVTERLDQIEANLGQSERYVTQEQASQISQAVKAVAIAQGKKSKRNEFGACYGELYRRYGITSYKMLPANKFEDAMKFLTDWHQSLEGDSPF